MIPLSAIVGASLVGGLLVGGLVWLGMLLRRTDIKTLNEDAPRKKIKLGKPLGFGLGAAVIIFVGLFVVNAVFFPNSQDRKPDTLPGVKLPASPTQTVDLQVTFGPFVSISPATGTYAQDTRSPALLVLNTDGSVNASTKWTVPFSAAKWQLNEANATITGISVDNGMARFRTNEGAVFKVAVNQPFLWNGLPTLYAIGKSRQVWSLSVTDALNLKRTIS